MGGSKTLIPHAKSKLTWEPFLGHGITEEHIKRATNESDETLYDTRTGRLVAVDYKSNIVVIFEKANGHRHVVTVIYCSKLKELVERRRKGRWVVA